jgi:small-conductance mechanosensitive channel
MNKGKRNQVSEASSQDLIQAGAAAELRLLRQERKAEERLGAAVAVMEKDQARLHKAQERLERSRDSVDAAAATLREAQSKRAEGPESSH